MYRIFIPSIKVYRFFKETSLCKAILQITIEYFHTVFFQILSATLPTIFPSIECIKKHTTDKTYFCLTVTLTISSPQMNTRIKSQRITSHQTIDKETAHYFFHILNRIRSINRSRSISVIAILPRIPNKIRIIISFILHNLPCQ